MVIHGTLSQCWLDTGPAFATLAQYQASIGSASYVCRDFTGITSDGVMTEDG